MLLGSTLLVALLAVPGDDRSDAIEIRVDPAASGRVFEGLGALSAGASSRLLREYPEAARSDVLDLLFRPHFGASLQHLKVEIGGDTNSTDGVEPSHSRSREELAHPQRAFYERGYEWWLMREARARNPGIVLDALAWGAPGWIGGGTGSDRNRFFSADTAEYLSAFVKGAKTYHDLDIGYIGIWNETPHDVAWIKQFRRTLAGQGPSSVRIVASDQTGQDVWRIAREMQADAELNAAVDVIGAHYPGFRSTPEALASGKRLWASEDGPWRGDWEGAQRLARAFNRNYIEGRMTKTIFWSLVTSYYDTLPLPGSGPMRANSPWSGQFEVQPALWAIAHTTQFAEPGWLYIDPACVRLPAGGSVVTLRDPSSGHVSVIAETTDALAAHSLHIQLPACSTERVLHVWKSTKQQQFLAQTDLVAHNGQFTLELEPDAIVSLTTTTGQCKGEPSSPPARPFPMPYGDDFEATQIGAPGRYFGDQGGVFEIAQRPDEPGRCLRQVLERRSIDWPFHPTPQPYTLIGSAGWRNYEVRCDIRLEKGGLASIWGRVSLSPQTAEPAHGYRLEVGHDGRWRLAAFDRELAAGQAGFDADRWHTLVLRFLGSTITAHLDGHELATLTDGTYRRGQAGLGSGWNPALFDNFQVLPASETARVDEVNLARGADVSGSSTWSPGFEPRLACDGNPQTRWNAAKGNLGGEWLEVDLGEPRRFDAVRVVPFGSRIAAYRVEVAEANGWRTIARGIRKDDAEWVDELPLTTADRLRLVIESTSSVDPESGTASIRELEVFERCLP